MKFSDNSRVGIGHSNSSNCLLPFSGCSLRSFWAHDFLLKEWVVRQSGHPVRKRLELQWNIYMDRTLPKWKQTNNPPPPPKKKKTSALRKKYISISLFLSNSLMSRNPLNTSPVLENKPIIELDIHLHVCENLFFHQGRDGRGPLLCVYIAEFYHYHHYNRFPICPECNIYWNHFQYLKNSCLWPNATKELPLLGSRW